MSPIKRSHTVGWGLVAAALLLLGVFTVSKLYSNGVADSATNSAVDLGQQVQQACAAKTLSGPLCQKADDVVRDPAPSPLTAVGAAGQAGANGTDGRTPPCYYTASQCVGPEGKQGLPGIMGAMGIPGLDGKPGADGLPGKDGVDGKDGTNGTNGEPGAPGTPGAEGPAGAPGADGKPGTDGRDGAPPESWSWPDPVLIGTTHVCTRVNEDDAHPTYSCT